MSSHTHRFAPLAEEQRKRLADTADLLTAAYGQWMNAVALEFPENQVNNLKKRFHNYRAAFDLLKKARGLRKGDVVRVYSGPHKGEQGTVTGLNTAGMPLVDWAPGALMGSAEPNRQPHAWMLELVRSATVTAQPLTNPDGETFTPQVTVIELDKSQIEVRKATNPLWASLTCDLDNHPLHEHAWLKCLIKHDGSGKTKTATVIACDISSQE